VLAALLTATRANAAPDGGAPPAAVPPPAPPAATAPPPPAPPPPAPPADGDQRAPTVKAAAEAATQAAGVEKTAHEQAGTVDSFVKTGDLNKAEVAAAATKSSADSAAALAAKATQQASETTDPAQKPEAEKAKASANTAAANAKKDADNAQKMLDAAKGSAGCSGLSPWCLFGGVQVVGYSLTNGAGSREGQTAHHVVDLAIPTVGIRWAISQYVSLDMAFYTAIVSPQFQLNTASPTGSGCGKKTNAFEDALPCEGNAALRPYAGTVVGFTAGTGSSSLGIMTIGITTGVARTTQDPSAFGFYGVTVTTGGLYATIPVGKISLPKDAPAAEKGAQ
jgi:hypothetical protein